MARSHVARDYYARLGVPSEASAEEIRRAYRRLALEWHPDRNPGKPSAGARFRDISEAYAVLSDPEKRRAYDAARRAGEPGPFQGGREDLLRDLFANAHASSVFDELARELHRHGVRVDRRHFEQTLFGRGSVVTGFVVVTPGPPIGALFRIAKAVLGTAARPDAIRRPEPRAAEIPASREREGLWGQLARAGRWLLGLPSTTADGADREQPLRLTRTEARQGGRRRVTLSSAGGHEEAVLVTIPPGVTPGTRLRLRGKGHRLPGRPPGDAYLTVEIVD